MVDEEVAEAIRNDIERDIDPQEGAKTLWRVGQPRVTEAWLQSFSASRGSGGYGTGIYAYATREGAQGDRSAVASGGDQPVIALEGALERPLVVGSPLKSSRNRDDIRRLHTLGKEMSAIARSIRNDPGVYDEVREELLDESVLLVDSFRTGRLVEPKGLGSVASKAGLVIGGQGDWDIDPYDEQELALAALDACREAAEQSESVHSGLLLQPMNFLLWPTFDGVYPLPGGGGGDSNKYGAVVFREKVDECVGREVANGENVDPEALNRCFRRQN